LVISFFLPVCGEFPGFAGFYVTRNAAVRCAGAIKLLIKAESKTSRASV